MSIKRAIATLIVLVVTMTLVPAPAEAMAGTPITRCGQELNGAMYLARSLRCDVGFRVPPANEPRSADVDMRGHRLSGRGAGIAFSVRGGEPFFNQLTIRNGRIDNWDLGVDAVWAGLHLVDVKLDHNDVGLYCGAGNCTVKHSVLWANTIGNTANEAGLNFESSLFIDNGTASQAYGPRLVGGRYTGNTFVGNTIGIAVAGEGGAEVVRNIFTGNGVGVKNVQSSRGYVGWSVGLDGNTFVGNGDGVHLTTSFDRDETASLRNNTAVKNKRYGFYVAPSATDLGGNKAAANGKPCVGVVCSRS